MTQASLKERLIDTALEMMTKDGATGLSLRAVARAAEVSEAAPYTYFKGKPDLMAQIAAHGFDRLSARMNDAPQSPDPVEALCALGRAYLAFAQKNRALYALMFTPESGLDQTAPAYVQSSARAFEALRTVSANCAGYDVDSDQARNAALAAWSLVHGLTQIAPDSQATTELALRALARGLAEQRA